MATRLTQSAVIRELQERAPLELSLKETKQIVETIAQIAEDEISGGYDFKLPGVATVRLAYQPKKGKRLARNPATGEEFMANPVPAKIAVRARPDARMKRSAPSPSSKAGKQIADKYKAAKGL